MSIKRIIKELRSYDEEQVCDLLEITTDDLIKAFKDRVYLKKDYLIHELEILEEGKESFRELNFDD